MLPGLQPDPEFILTNIEILNLTAVPKSLAIIGAGAVGVEFASIFKRFGTDVTVIEMLPRVVPVEDEDISKELERVFRKQKIRVETGAQAENIQKTGKGVKLTLTTKDGKQEVLETEKLLVAVGRKPNTDKIGLENTKVELDRGFIKVDAVSADRRAGRVCHRRRGGRHPATGPRGHARRHDRGGAHGRQTRRSRSTRTASRAPPTRSPASAASGMTEAQARAQGYKVKVGKFPFAGDSRATILGHHDGFIKVVADENVWRDSGRSHHRPGRLRTARRSGSGHGGRGHGRRHDADHSCPSHALRGHGRSFQRGLRSLDQCVIATCGNSAASVTAARWNCSSNSWPGGSRGWCRTICCCWSTRT